MTSSSKRGEYGRQRRKYVAEGFKEDALKLLYEFGERKVYDLPNFVKLWNEAYMPMIYMGRTSKRELCEFTNECFAIMISLITKEDSPITERVGATYLLYCLYASQPFDRYKIRITFKDFKSMYSLVGRAVDAKIPHLVYAVLKLQHVSAFHFVGNMALMGPEIPNTRCIIRQEYAFPSVTDHQWTQYFRNFWESQNLQKFNHIDKTYENMKRVMADPINSGQMEEGGPNAAIMRLVQMAADCDNEIYGLLDSDEEDSNAQCKKDADIGMRRLALKQQQMDMIPGRKRSTRKKKTTADDSLLDVGSDDGDLCIDDPSVIESRRTPSKRLRKNGHLPNQTQKITRRSRKKGTKTSGRDLDDDHADAEADNPDGKLAPRRSLRRRTPSKAATTDVDSDQEEKIEISDCDADADYVPGRKRVDWTFDFLQSSEKSAATKDGASTSSQTGSKKGKTAKGSALKTTVRKRGRRKKEREPIEKVVRRKIGRGKKLKRHYNTDSDDDADPLQNVDERIESGDDLIEDIAKSMTSLFQMKRELDENSDDSKDDYQNIGDL